MIHVYVSFSFLGMPSKFRVSLNDTDKLKTTGECDLIINDDSITVTNPSTGMNKIKLIVGIKVAQNMLSAACPHCINWFYWFSQYLLY